METTGTVQALLGGRIASKKKAFGRWTQWEHWPAWAFYLPVALQHLWLWMRTGSFFYFLRTNPGIGGFILGDSKFETLGMVPQAHRPATMRVPAGTNPMRVEEGMRLARLEFPVIIKPDKGCRGIGVAKIETPAELYSALDRNRLPVLLQEYVHGPEELGVFYHRMPGATRGVISSLTLKRFMGVVGDGTSTLAELISAHPRARSHSERLRVKFHSQWGSVPATGEAMELEPIGNHNRGTQFINGNHLIDDRLVAVFDRLTAQMDGFYFGRFDLRTESLEALKRGGEFKILEVNGIGAEPAHMYDPHATTLWGAWGALCHSWRQAARIARANLKNGASKPGLSEAWRRWVESRT